MRRFLYMSLFCAIGVMGAIRSTSSQAPVFGQPQTQGPVYVGPSASGASLTPLTCTNQFVRTLTASSGTCGSIANADLGTTLTPQFARIGVGQAAGASALFTFTGGAASTFAPSADSTTAVVFTKSDASTAVLTLDTTNSKAIVTDSSSTVPKIVGSNSAYGGGPSGTIAWKFLINGAEKVQVYTLNTGSSQPGIAIASDGAIGFNSATDFQSGSDDVALRRNGSNILELNTGTNGTFADLKLRTIIHPTTTAVAVANVGANSCGTSAATITGNENVGAFTVGATSGTQCRITFTTTAPNRRHCVFDDETTTIAVRSTYVDTTHTDALGAFVAGDVVSYVCAAR